MNKTLIFLSIVILLSGCIVIEEAAENETSQEDVNVTFDLEEETETSGETANEPDLKITKIYWSTLFPDINQNDELNIRIMNRGDVSVNGFDYKITLFKGSDTWKEESYSFFHVCL